VKTAIVVIVDGVNQRSFEKLRKLGKLPFIDELSKESIEVKKCISVFPSATVSGHASIATCIHPGYHGLVGQSWFDRQSGEFIGYDFELTLPDNWIDASTKLSDEHLTVKTCYDVLRQRGVKTFSVDLIKRADYNFSFIKPGIDRGVGFARFLMFLRRFARYKSSGGKLSKLAKMFLPVFQHEVAVRNTIKAIKLGCRFGIVWFMETDFASHLFSPEKFEGNGKPYIYDSFEDALRDVDEEVEKLYNRVVKITGEEPILALLTDHGQSALKSGKRYHLDLVEVFSEYNLNAFTNLDLKEYEAKTKKKADAVIAVSGPRMAHVYALRNREKVLEVLRSLECVDQIIIRDERIVYHEGEAFRLEEVDEVLGEEYPHAFERIDGLIVSERCGDFIITAKKGYEFEKADYKGAHGSLIYDDSVGFAMIRRGKNLEIEECFITDVIKLVLREFIP
jgi:predicted AlkP superfamily pyrophosphatase or phosphodiesterase